MRLHYKVLEGESIQYCDVMSLSLHLKIIKVYRGTIVLHVGETWQDTEAMLHKEELIKCTILPPKPLYHPVLLFSATTDGYSVFVGRGPWNRTVPPTAHTNPSSNGYWYVPG
jgi:hypothetical protein